MFKYFNPHPKGTTTEVGDCVKRSIVVATGMDYMEVQRALNAYKKITGAKAFNSGHNPHRYAEEVLGAKKIAVASGTTVADFCRAHARGRFILDLPEHWVGVYDSDYYDTWDCGKETVNFAYEISTPLYTPPNLQKQVFKYCCTSKIISDTQTSIRIYDGNGTFVERKIPTELTAGYLLCLQHSNYQYINLDEGESR